MTGLSYPEKVSMFVGAQVNILLKGCDKVISGTVYEVDMHYIVMVSDRTIVPSSSNSYYTQPKDKYQKYIPIDAIAVIEYETPEQSRNGLDSLKAAIK